MQKIRKIFSAFKEELPVSIQAIGAGNINDTFRVETSAGRYLLQRINHQVFKQPTQVQVNYERLYAHLHKIGVTLELPALIKTKTGDLFYESEDKNYWRLLTFIENTQAIERPSSSMQVKEAASRLGTFVAALNQGTIPVIEETIPNFHHIQLRLEYFKEVEKNAVGNRREIAQKAIDYIEQQVGNIPDYHALGLPRRLVHNDPKIGNVLFDRQWRVVAVIDWDTIMPGFIATDLGDMVRTMAVTAGENERDLQKVGLKDNYLELIIHQFLLPLKNLLTEEEVAFLFTGPKYIVLEQALRFLSDYLAGDPYYKIQYPEHNLMRSLNQIEVCRAIDQQESLIKKSIEQVFAR